MKKLKDRIIYAKMSWDKVAKKKKVYFGGAWGEMNKSEANASAIKTGDGLVVVDIDTHNMGEVDTKLVKILKRYDPTVNTARGSHRYFKDKKSEQFINKASYLPLVDIRSDGGIVFNQYLGSNKNISYTKVGKIHDMPKDLRKYLLKCMKISQKKVKNRAIWSEVPKGEIHDGTLRYAFRDFNNGLSYDDVIGNGLAYVETYLGGSKREVSLMLARIKWCFENRSVEKLDAMQGVSEDIGGDFEDTEVLKMLQKAQKGGALELEKTMKEIKKKLKISVSVMKEMLRESPDSSEGISQYFKGEIVWDSALGVFVEVRDKSVEYYSKSGFSQTVISKSGWCTPSDVTEKLHTIPHKFVIYNPTKETGEMFNENGDECINVFRGVDFGEGKKKFKTIDKILDNLFSDDMLARDEFINWIATIVQLGCRTGVAWAFFGASGSGKGFVAEMMGELLGHSNCSLNVGDTDLSSTFNPYMHHKQFVHLNEISYDYHGRHGVSGKMKAYIADPFIRINQKNIKELATENFANIIINSNKPNPIEIDQDDRRYNAVVSKKSLTSCDWWDGDKSYQKALRECKAFGRYLLDYKIDMQRAMRPMGMSVAKAGIIEQTSSPLQLIGTAIKNNNFKKIVDILELDSSEIVITEKLIKESCTLKRWSNILLTDIYIWATGRTDLKGYEVRKYFITPFISTKSVVWKEGGNSIRGASTR